MKKPLAEKKKVSQRTIQLRRGSLLSLLATLQIADFIFYFSCRFYLFLTFHTVFGELQSMFTSINLLTFVFPASKVHLFFSFHDSAGCKPTVLFHLIYLYYDGQKQLEAIYGL